MSLARALVDRARRVYVAEDPVQVWREGEPRAEERYGPWVAVRHRSTSTAEAGGAGQQVNEEASLIISAVYADGTPVWAGGRFTAWDADDLVEVETAEGDSFQAYVNGGVTPMRRRSGYVGFRCSLRRAREPEVAEEQLPAELDTSGIVVGGGGGVSPDWSVVIGGEPG